MTFEKTVKQIFSDLKSRSYGEAVIRAPAGVRPQVELVSFTSDCVDDDALIELLARWRGENQDGVAKVFTPTTDSTRHWARTLVIKKPDHHLFLVRTGNGALVGHVGLDNFDFGRRTCQVSNVVRGEPVTTLGVMTSTIRTLLDWTYQMLRPREIHLSVMSDNVRALALFHRTGFRPVELLPLHRVEGPDFVEWIPVEQRMSVDRIYMVMQHVREGQP